jgi:hypothetical protein
MKNNIRKFALVIVDDFDNEIPNGRFELDYADTPRNLGFELEFTTLESRLTTYFTSAREKKLPVTLNLNFLRPNAYEKANAFKAFVQKHINRRMVFEYNDTTKASLLNPCAGIKNWEGKIQKFGQDELTNFKSLVCPISFLPATPKYIRKDNVITIRPATTGKSYPFKYPYSYGKSTVENNIFTNNYFDEIPLRVHIYGAMNNPQISLQDTDTSEVYSTVRFENLYVAEDEELIIDAIQSKVLIKRNGIITSAYDYLSKDASLDSFLYAKANTTSKVVIVLNPLESGYLKASYRQYTL